ncbi:X-Pro dipeptidyl-peptidase [Longimycelium tulufanense]|uniref:X-Pro dipeptidyl-peptidase n=1 Tax=Longimycelium tulufanense TaxID=907463 RepID=A0A8J3CAQ2_9PSEU|nr:Xaa-Pro dipeptidyl-peptidase [Longimycelium tulufanense]GGM66102.1 X-Pro dipeptidyl-peptidase [Longimycelium tulufanense]
MSRRLLLALTALATLLSALAAPASAEPSPAHVVTTGVTQPIYDFARAVRETVWVDIGMDGDRDNVRDRVAADIIRPAEPATRGQRVPVIMVASPYFSCCGRGNDSEHKTYDKSGRPVGFPLFYDNYFVPRGYAVVLVDLAGTNRSEGCVDVGGRSDVMSAKAVVDWLNGRANGYDAKAGGRHVRAGWSTGAVGMIGKSYDGTIANGVAALGVPGLRTIVPIGAISSWYDYYRSDGVSFGFNPDRLARTVEENGGRPDCRHVKDGLSRGAPANGNVTPLWTARDYVPGAQRVKASVFVVHGQGDLNVKTIHFGQWWNELAKAGVPRKLWLGQAGHVDPFDFRRAEWVRTLHRWFDRWLLNVPNGIDREPVVSIERHPDQWVDEPSWPTANGISLRMRRGDTPGIGRLGVQPPGPGATESFTDDPRQSEFDWAKQPNQPFSERVVFNTGPLAEDLRLSGTGEVTVTVRSSTPTAHVSAVLVHYGPNTIRDYLGAGEGVHTLTSKSCWGSSRPGDTACFRDTATTTKEVDLEVFARGWADIGNHASLRHGERLRPGAPYTMTFRLSTTDHVVPAGHQLALIIGGTDGHFIVAPAQPPQITIDLNKSSVHLPIAGTPPPMRGEAREPEIRPDRIPTEPEIRLEGDVVRG